MLSGSSAAVWAGSAVDETEAAAYRAAIVPFKIQGGRDGTRQQVEPKLRAAFEAKGFTPVWGQPVLDAIKKVGGEALAVAGSDGFGILPAETMSSIGRCLHTRYVVCGQLTIKSKRTWHLCGPRAKCDVFIKTTIVDAQTGEVMYTESDAATSKANTNAQTGVAILVSWPVALLLGGKIGEQESKALTLALSKTYEGFFLKVATTPVG
jgi:hypothetical protein